MPPFFPKQIAYRAIIIYFIALVAVSLFFIDYAMKFQYIVMGSAFVSGFFIMVNDWTTVKHSWKNKQFGQRLFILAVSLRLLWVVASYFYYIQWTGGPFEYDAADSMGYHDEASWLAGEKWETTWYYYFGERYHGIGDIGYPLYLTVLYKIFGPNILIPRIIKAFLSAYTCILLYRMTTRMANEETGRMAGIMCALMPNLIIYCGYHLKETEMLFLVVAYMERADYLFRTRKWNFLHIVIPMLLAVSLFFFRTVLGTAAVFSYLTAVLLINTPSMKRGWKRAAVTAWSVLLIAVVGGGKIQSEIEEIWEGREENVVKQRYKQSLHGNQWAQYATGAVMAPMIMVLPFSTMVDVDQQYAQQTKHGGNYIRNFMGLFAILGIYEAFRRKQWKNYSLVGVLAIAYYIPVALSGFSNSERFLLPGIPCLIVMWAYGISTLRPSTYKLLNPWSMIVLAMEIGWAYFKLGSRGIV